MELAKTIIYLLVGLVVFVTGMNMMSRGLKNAAGKSIRRLFKKIGDNKIAAASIGAGTTAIIQSSGATTVMVVGFLSAGALTFAQGFSLMLGAFVGTTITGVLVSLSSFSFSMFLMALAFVGFVLGFFKSPTVKSIGEVLVGFGILFFGLEAMKTSFNDATIQKALIEMLSTINFPLLLMLIGAVLTAITQSSSATDGIVIIMVAANPSLLSSGFYLVIGATVGALMPTILATLKSGILAKRVTCSILIARILGALLFTVLIWAISVPLFNWLETFPTEDVGMILALFNVIYSLVFILVFLPLSKPMEALAMRLFKDRDAERKKQALRFINDNMLNTPSTAILQVKKEIESMLELSRINFFLGMDAVFTLDLSKAKEIEDREENIDYINEQISDYLIKLSSRANMRDEAHIGAYYHVINDIERIGDHAYNFLEMARSLKDEELAFSDLAKEEFLRFRKILEEMFALSDKIFMNSSTKDLAKLHDLEGQTDTLKDELSNAHFERIKNNQCKNELSPFHSTFLSEMERVADHLTNIGYSIVSPTGDDIKHTKKR
ncbi:MAG: Na/Pi cotransporter family protein [Bacilli bacterium]|nr:Na/Pi cotransporter family protein [Bacilli bacterium]